MCHESKVNFIDLVGKKESADALQVAINALSAALLVIGAHLNARSV